MATVLSAVRAAMVATGMISSTITSRSPRVCRRPPPVLNLLGGLPLGPECARC